jgi:hypothetical protein
MYIYKYELKRKTSYGGIKITIHFRSQTYI